MIMQIHNPAHPGEIIRELCLEPLGLSVTKAAEGLGVSRKTLSAILNGRAGISPQMALRLSLAFDTTPESWLNQQTQYDLWAVKKGKERASRKETMRRLTNRCAGQLAAVTILAMARTAPYAQLPVS
jgi:addiction module HigA family antidote